MFAQETDNTNVICVVMDCLHVALESSSGLERNDLVCGHVERSDPVRRHSALHR